MKTFFARFVPFFVTGIMLVLVVLGIIIVSKLLILGAIIGFVLYSVAYVRELIFRRKTHPLAKKPRGRHTIDQ
jgi:uncharacterized membrane protein SpoIIM required for sporulation